LSSGNAEISPLDIQSEADVDALPILDVRHNGRLPLVLGVAEKLVQLQGRKVPVVFLWKGCLQLVPELWERKKC